MELPYELTPDDILVRIRTADRNPNIRGVSEVTLKSGPQVFRFAKIVEIVNPQTGAHHHFTLSIQTFSRTKKYGWREKPDQCVSLESESPDELTALVRFIQSVQTQRFPAGTGDFRIVAPHEYGALSEVLTAAIDTGQVKRIEILGSVLRQMNAGDLSPHDWLGLFSNSKHQVSRTIAIAARMVEYKREYLALKALVTDPDTKETPLQRILAKNPWMFGSEYSELLDRRTWTRDDNLDFMLRRTSDGYLEIVEIKTPFQKPLFRHDSSHDSYAPTSDLSLVLGQALRYIEEIERNRDSIKASDQEDPFKIRARIIIGRDGDENQQRALRSLNAHLHRIEILTFDQLLKIARRVLTVFAQNAREIDND